jgi:glycosyltransferase involved in cell wall biosynthesis
MTSDKRYRILLICNSYPPVLGGSEVEAQRMSVALIRRGHPVHVLCAGGPPMPAVRDWVDPAGVPVSILTRNSRGRWRDLVFAFEVTWTLWRERHNYDLVYFLMQGLHVVPALRTAHFLGKPSVMKISGDGIISLMSTSRIGRLELRWLRQWNVPVMVLNDSMVAEALRNGFPREQLTWMPNPVDIDEFCPAPPEEVARWRKDHGIPTAVPVVIYTGRLSHEKGLVPLLRGYALAAQTTPGCMLVLVGDGPMRTELEQLARELNLGPEQLKFTGRVDGKEVPSWLQASDVFALTSPNEGFSCALVEAMAAGLSSVVSAIPANQQLIAEGVHGLTVPFDNVEAIGQAFLRLFHDPGLCCRMGQAARQRAIDNYSTIRVVERYEALFSKAPQSAHGSQR